MDPASIPAALGDFQVVAVLGRGGSGIVYDATWGPRRVALKVLQPDLVGTERERTQFLAEAKRLQTITHPSVVKVLAVGELPDGRPYLAMERLEGETLAGVLARGPIALPEALALFGELCTAVGALHDQNLVHRDLKPENVFIVGGRHAVLLDFGIAKELAAAASTTTMDGRVRGTPAYMAPERFFGQPAGVATDLYELAVTLYAMLAARLPWDDLADPEARLSPRPLIDFAPVPPELDIEIRRAMSTRAQNRPASATALLEAVRAAAGDATDAAPAETAKMRKAQEPSSTVTADRQPWFAQRQATTDRGKTPLAWVPDAAPAPPPKKRKRWPMIVGAMGIAAAAGGLAAWRLGGDGEQATPLKIASEPPPITADAAALDNDPWAVSSAPVVNKEVVKLSATAPELSIEEARKEAAAAIVHVPADTRVLFSVTINELRKNKQFDDILGRIKKQPMVAQLMTAMPDCVQSILTGAEWAVYASKALDDGEHATLIVRGRWNRDEVERCFKPDAIPLRMPDGKTMMQLRRVGWIDFLDDHTVYVSVRDDLAAAQVHDLVKHGGGPAAHAGELFAKMPANRTLAVAIDGSTGLEWPKDYLPKGSDATAWLRVDEVTEFDVAADARSEDAAGKLVAQVKPQFDELFKERESSILGSIKVTREKTVMRIRGKMSSLMIAMISSAIP